MQSTDSLQNWIARLDRRVYAILIGLAIGIIGGGIGLLIAAFDPLLAFGAVFGVLIALYVLTNVSAALYATVAMMAFLPFGTVPFKIAFTPSLLDGAMGAFLLVYLFQWMTGKRQLSQTSFEFRLTPVYAPLLLYIGWLIFSFALGLRYAPPTAQILREFMEALLSIGMVFILVDLLRDPASFKRLLFIIAAAATVEALVGIILYVIPDALAERTLVRLARIGYPNGGVIRYINDDPAEAERAIGTWVDPNAFGGFLVVTAAMIAPQVFAWRPVVRWRIVAWGMLGLVSLALLLTYSRASMLALGFTILFVGLFRGNRKFIALVLLALIGILILPQTRDYVVRFVEAFTASDLSTQMRLGEYGDALRLIREYPVTGVGFTGTPSIDLYTNAASMYLIMANQIGLVGVGIFAATMLSVFGYGLRAWRRIGDNPELRPLLLGFHAALLAALINGAADLYFFRLDFHASITLFWLAVALSLASSRMALDAHIIEASEQEVSG
ncbi:MAG TPA: O-antigen ligase family protein [Phototrophicaceae bacterium]|nr:O-antigen ligase family protein [Phototrophicaceae bacterium]